MFSILPTNRSIIDEIRNEIRLDEYYRKSDLNSKEDCDFCDDPHFDYEYVSDSNYD